MSLAISLPTEPTSQSLHRFSLKDYFEISRLGLLGPDDRVELLDGLVVKKVTRGPRHCSVTHRLFGTLNEAVVMLDVRHLLA